MKHTTITILLALAILAGHAQDTTYSKDKPEKGYLISYYKATNIWDIKPIIRVTTFQKIDHLHDSMVYHWHGLGIDSLTGDSTGMYWWTVPGCDSCGPCGGFGGAAGYWGKYEGDSIINRNNSRSIYREFKSDYYLPPLNKKKVLGKKYDLKDNEHWGIRGTWHPQSLIFTCI